MKFLEKDLEQIIFETDNDLLRGKGLGIAGIKKRQVKIGNYGIADLITIRKEYSNSDVVIPELYITIFELKKNEISISSFLQAIRYLKGIQRYLKIKKSYYTVHYKIVLIGETIDKKNDFIYLTDLIHDDEYGNGFFVEYYTYELNFNGIEFNEHCNYILTEEGF
jgi:hypothetical protein